MFLDQATLIFIHILVNILCLIIIKNSCQSIGACLLKLHQTVYATKLQNIISTLCNEYLIINAFYFISRSVLAR